MVWQLAGSAPLLLLLQASAPLGLRLHLGGLASLGQVALAQVQLALVGLVLGLQGQEVAVAVAMGLVAVPVGRLCWA